MKNLCVLFCFLFLGNTIMAQTKFEKESRLSVHMVPDQAKQFVYQLLASKQVKWYHEIHETGQSIEAKTKYQNKKYSIEFNMDGSLQDIEVETHKDDISVKTYANITNVLEIKFDKHWIKKIQIQYSGSKEALLAFFKSGHPNNITTNYEIVLKGKTKNDKALYEYLFNEEGTLKSTKTIIFRNTDNIQF